MLGLGASSFGMSKSYAPGRGLVFVPPKFAEGWKNCEDWVRS
jgi:hypothetical protein